MAQRGSSGHNIIGIGMRQIQGDLDGIDRGDGRHAPQECNRAKQHGSTDENDNDRNQREETIVACRWNRIPSSMVQLA